MIESVWVLITVMYGHDVPGDQWPRRSVYAPHHQTLASTDRHDVRSQKVVD